MSCSSRRPFSLDSRLQCLNFRDIASLEPSTRTPKNPTAFIDLEDRLVLGGDIGEDVRVVNGCTKNHSYRSRQALYACSHVAELVDLDSHRTSDVNALPFLLMFRTGHVSGRWPVHHRTYRNSGNYGRCWRRSSLRFETRAQTSPFAGVSAIPSRTVGLLTVAGSVNSVKEPLLTTSADDYELDSASPHQQEHNHSSQRPPISLSASPTNSHPRSISPPQMSPSFQYTPPAAAEQSIPATAISRSKSKPNGIFIHPAHSNFARAEVIAVRMGFGIENNEYVDPSSYTYPRSPSQNSNDTPVRDNRRGWGTGNGRDVARGLLAGSSSAANAGW